MTIKELEKICRKIKDKSLQVMMDSGDGMLLSVCGENSQLELIPILEDDETEEDITGDTQAIAILLLVPCHHECEMEEGEINSQPELN